MGSTSLQSQQLLHKVGGHARPEQDGGNDDVELDLNLLHPALATLQLLLDRLVPLTRKSLRGRRIPFRWTRSPRHSCCCYWILLCGNLSR
jgi:hypothetical protein